jgi:hypothetical protein
MGLFKVASNKSTEGELHTTTKHDWIQKEERGVTDGIETTEKST